MFLEQRSCAPSMLLAGRSIAPRAPRTKLSGRGKLRRLCCSSALLDLECELRETSSPARVATLQYLSRFASCFLSPFRLRGITLTKTV